MLNYSQKAITVHKEGWGGGVLFDRCVGSGHFFLFKFLKYIIYLFIYFFFFFFFGGGGGSEILIFGGGGGYGDFVDIFWRHNKIGLVLGVSSMHCMVFS